ncbi:MAG: serine hydrolase [Actinobacteria bacterium]|nr:serine hydrolase [Actinomycetota bacterium]MBU1493910.1 serine hydrolase [Actinomycetota bacterium]MBU1865766.1 serine hydrolase [Actinomycetota bacterium]
MIQLAALALSLTLTPSHGSLHPIDLPIPPISPLVTEAPPDLDAASWALYSVDREAELLAVNGDLQRAMASVTKVMTAILVVENAQPSEVVTISERAARTPVGYTGQPHVNQGERWTVEELLAFLMVQSGNDGAVALAEHVGGSLETFVTLMNQRAAALGMRATSFANPNGLDAAQHFSSARDLIKMGRAAIDYDRILRVTSIKAITFRPTAGRELTVTNTNRLLGVFPGVFGLKTGDTVAANRVLLAYQEFGSRKMLSVVMGTADHYGATADLLTYGMTTLGPRDHLLAPALGTALEPLLPDWMIPRLEAIGALPSGLDSVSAPGSTPGEIRAIAAFRDLLPPLLGGDS